MTKQKSQRINTNYVIHNTKQKNYGARLRSPGYDGILAGQYTAIEDELMQQYSSLRT